MIQIDQNGKLKNVTLGSDLFLDQEPQVIVPPHTWQAAKLIKGGKWALMGCTVAPGFEFADFVGATYADLAARFPEHKKVIRDFTRG